MTANHFTPKKRFSENQTGAICCVSVSIVSHVNVRSRILGLRVAFSQLTCGLSGISESFLDFLPVDKLPDLLEEVDLGTLVVNIESVLPDIDVEEGN